MTAAGPRWPDTTGDDQLAGWRITPAAYADPDVRRLLDEVQAFYVERYGGPDETPLDPLMFEPPAGSFFLGHLDGEPVATGAWRRTAAARVPGTGASEAVAEIKRMYVAPRAQRRGLARRMLAHLEATAADSGVAALVLETGMAQPEALALYESSGYLPIEGYGHYRDSPLSRCFAKVLPGRDPQV